MHLTETPSTVTPSAATPSTATTPSAQRAAPQVGAAPTRRRRALAVILDFSIYLGIQIALGVAALAVFVAQTGAGERDLTSSAATVGWAVAAASVPAWLGLLARDLIEGSATPGERRVRLRVAGARSRRIARLLVHPLAALGWGWLAVVAVLATIPGIPMLLAAASVTVGAAGLISAVMLAVNADAIPLHDRIAGTRLVALREAEQVAAR